MKFPPNIKYVIGIDEVGRGPLAGPVAVGVCLLPIEMTRSKFRGIRDSKQLTAKMREEWLEKMHKMNLNFSVTLVSNRVIDERGIVFAIKQAMKDSLEKIEKMVGHKPRECMVLLDGGLHAPAKYIFQKTIIKGDEKVHSISLASIAAKVTRDAHMCEMAKIYPDFGFEFNKGYGTHRHILKIKERGITSIHRKSFLKKIVD